MGNIIEFLARAGSDAALRHASADAVRTALLEAGIEDEALGAALFANDGDAVRALMGQRDFICSQMPDGPPQEEEEPFDGEDEDGDGEPDGNMAVAPTADPSR